MTDMRLATAAVVAALVSVVICWGLVMAGDFALSALPVWLQPQVAALGGVMLLCGGSLMWFRLAYIIERCLRG